MRWRRRHAVTEPRGQHRLDSHAAPGGGPRRWSGLLSSLRVRLILWYVAILALILILCSGAIYATERQFLLAQMDSQLTTRLQHWATTYDARSGRLAAVREPAIAQGTEIVLLVTPTGRVVQTLAAGRLSAVKMPWNQAMRTMQAVARSGTSTVVEQGLQLTTSAAATKDGITPVTTTHAILFRLTGLSLTVRRRVMALLVVGLRSDVPPQMATLARTLETVVPLTLLLCAGGGYWLADRALRPIQAITRTAQEIGATDLSKRLNVQRRDEVGQLGATLDHMFSRLETAFARQRQFTADASHELRTPLAILDLEATRALARPRTPAEYRRAIAIMQEETGRMTRLVDDLLILARADSGGRALPRTDVDLGEVVLDVAERLAPLAQRSAMALTIEALPEALVWGDQGALTRMLTNIVENALTYAAAQGTQVRLSGGFRRDNDVAGVWLQVADDGPGIAAEHLPHLCERFYRIDHARTHSADTTQEEGVVDARPTGSGLGLAISQWIVGDHGGTLRIEAACDHGVMVDIWLPVSDTREE